MHYFRRRAVALSVTICIVVIIASVVIRAQTGQIKGRVVDTNGSPVASLPVTITENSANGRSFRLKTNQKGEFIQIGLKPGDYTVSVSDAWRPGVSDQERQVHITLDMTEIEIIVPANASGQWGSTPTGVSVPPPPPSTGQLPNCNPGFRNRVRGSLPPVLEHRSKAQNFVYWNEKHWERIDPISWGSNEQYCAHSEIVNSANGPVGHELYFTTGNSLEFRTWADPWGSLFDQRRSWIDVDYVVQTTCSWATPQQLRQMNCRTKPEVDNRPVPGRNAPASKPQDPPGGQGSLALIADCICRTDNGVSAHWYRHPFPFDTGVTQTYLNKDVLFTATGVCSYISMCGKGESLIGSINVHVTKVTYTTNAVYQFAFHGEAK